MKLYSDFYTSDIIVASPLGLVTNWTHVNTVFDHLNWMPSKQHGTDIMRIRPWFTHASMSFFQFYVLNSSVSTQGEELDNVKLITLNRPCQLNVISSRVVGFNGSDSSFETLMGFRLELTMRLGELKNTLVLLVFTLQLLTSRAVSLIKYDTSLHLFENWCLFLSLQSVQDPVAHITCQTALRLFWRPILVCSHRCRMFSNTSKLICASPRMEPSNHYAACVFLKIFTNHGFLFFFNMV